MKTVIQDNLNSRLNFAIKTAKIVGSVILKLRDCKNLPEYKNGNQVKSFADEISERLITSFIKIFYPKDKILSEEGYEQNKKFSPAESFWIIDSLDGTASYCGGYNGFCVQIAYIKKAKPVVGAVYAPTTDSVYWAIEGRGAYLEIRNNKRRLVLNKNKLSNKTYIDSRPAKGDVSHILKEVGVSKFLELGSYGLKICKIAEGTADVFLKPEEFKIWDTAPGDLILKEAGGKLTLWDGEKIDYSGRKIYFKNLLAASPAYHKKILPYL